MPTVLTNEIASASHYRRETPGFSKFLVTSPQYDLTVVEVELSQMRVVASSPVSITATVHNRRASSSTVTLTLPRNGTTINQANVTLRANETRTVTFRQTFDTAGRFDIAVNGRDAGVLHVDENQANTNLTTTVSDGSNSESGDGTSGDDTGGRTTTVSDADGRAFDTSIGDGVCRWSPIGVFLFTLAILLLFLLWRRRTDDEDDADEGEEEHEEKRQREST